MPISNRLTWVFAVSATVAFSMIFWVTGVLQNTEPLSLTVLYRYWDYGYFPLITRLLAHGIGEAFALETLGHGLIQWPLSGLLPYSVLHAVFGSAGFVVGELVTNVARLWAYWFLLRGLRSKERVLVALILLFATSHFFLGDYTIVSIFKGVWSTRIPRDFVTSIFLILSLAMLERLPEILLEKGHGRLFVAALPLVLLANGDVYSALTVTLVYFCQLAMRLKDKQIKISRLIELAVFGAALMVPYVWVLAHVSADVYGRVGRYPVWDHLVVMEIPRFGHLVLLVGSGAGILLASRFQLRSVFHRIVVIAWFCFALSMVASPFFSVLSNSGIQEYQYAYRRDQFAALLTVLMTLAMAELIFSHWIAERWRQMVWLATAVLVMIPNFLAMSEFTDQYATKSAPVEVDEGPSDRQWRHFVPEVLEYIQQHRRPGGTIFATFDHPLRFFLLMQPDLYSYVSDPQFTPASDDELENRFLSQCARLEMSSQTVLGLLTDRNVHLRFISGGKYQFNRLWSPETLDHYPAQALQVLPRLRDNWSLVVPPDQIQRLLAKYEEMKRAGPSGWGFRPPDVIILDRVQDFNVSAIAGYTLGLENPSFRVYLKTP